MSDLFIPPRTADALAEIHPEGTRHKAALDIALPLIGNGMASDLVFGTLMSKFHPGLSEKEIRDVVRWAEGRGQPATSSQPRRYTRPVFNSPPAAKPKPPTEHARWWVGNYEIDVEGFKQLSQLAIPENRNDALCLALEMLWLGDDNLNIVCAFLEEDGKAKPHGPGRILSRDKWCEYVRSKNVPESKAGAWIRPNPCQQAGSGAAGAVTDSDITSWKYLLVESDVLPLPLQLALFAKLKLPIAAVIMSGGISAHAWIHVGAKNAQSFTEKSVRILSLLAPFGIDQCNKNPSRLSRLPCARRVIGAAGDGMQSLLWLNPSKPAITDTAIAELEDALSLPAIQEKPFRSVVIEATTRYEYLLENKGKLGVPTGFPTLQKYMGGWKAASLNVIAATTGGGKTTLALNFMNAALKEKIGVALFTLEMTKEDICDMLFSVNARIDRNRFNTGEFTESDLKSMAGQSVWMSNLPLWLDDSSTITVEQIRKQVLQLKADNRIGLVIVDYAQLVMPMNDRDSRELQVAAIARGLRVLAKDAQLPLIVLSQLNEDGKIRESRVLAHEAANVFVLETKENQDMILHTVKGRKIPSHPIPVYFEALYCRMAEKETRKIDESDMPKYE